MQMELVLLKNMRHLGKMGETKKVAMGYGRYLLRQGVALRATEKNKAEFEVQKAHWEKLNADQKQDAETMASLLENKIFSLVRQAGASGHLYGSVSNRDISKLLNEEGFAVVPTAVTMAHPLKETGVHHVPLMLHADVQTQIKIIVGKTEVDIQEQKQLLETPDQGQGDPL